MVSDQTGRVVKGIAMLSVAVALAGCDIGPSCSPITMSGSSQEQLRFAGQVLAPGATCAPPCWQGLTPGKSTKSDALKVLAGLSFVDQKVITDQGIDRVGRADLTWDYKDPASAMTSGAEFIPGGAMITLRFTSSHGQALEPLGTILDTFGEPDAYEMIPSHDFSCQSDELDWLDAGIAVHTSYDIVPNGDGGPRLSAQTPIIGITYFSPQASLTDYLRTVVGLPEKDIPDRLSSYRQWHGLDQTGSTPTP